MFDNSIDLHFNGGNKTLTRVNQDKFTSQYRHRDSQWSIDMTIRHTTRTDSVTKKPVDRHNVELTFVQFPNAGEPLSNAQTFKVYFVVEGPGTGDQSGAIVAIVNSLKDTMMTNDIVARLSNFES